MSLPRYPDYKDSGVEWLGRVPAHWQVDRLKAAITSCKNGLWGEEPQGDDSDIDCVRVADFDRERLVVDGVVPTQRSVTRSERAGRVLRRGDLLLEKSGGGERQPVGQVVLYDRDEPAVCSNFVAKVTLAEGMDSRYWMYQHAAAYAVGVNVVAIKQTSGIQNLDQSQYFNERGVFPSHAEQVQIAGFLDRETAKIDALIAEQEKLLALLAEKRQATISHAVTRGLDPSVPMKDSGIPWLGKVPMHWAIRSIKSLARQDRSIFIDGDWIESRNLSDDGIRYVTTGNVGVGHYKEQGSGFISNTTFADLGCTEVIAGDILISRLNLPIGRACVLPDLGMRVVTSVDNVIFRTDDDVDRYYLVYRFSAPDYLHETANLASGATMQRISRTELGAIRIALPPKEEQRSIANHLAQEINVIDTLTAEAERSVVLLRERRNALITAAVTGQIDVRGAAESVESQAA